MMETSADVGNKEMWGVRVDIRHSIEWSTHKDIPEEHENGKCCRYEIMVDESLLLWFYFEGVVL